MRTYRKLTVAALCASFAAAPLAAATPIAGNWLTADKSALVEVAPCGKALCGTIVKFLGANRANPDARDANNADPAKRNRRILGMAILTGFVPDGDKWKGQIYDPRSGKTYKSILVRKGNAMDVKGCVAFFCQTQVWTRAQ